MTYADMLTLLMVLFIVHVRDEPGGPEQVQGAQERSGRGLRRAEHGPRRATTRSSRTSGPRSAPDLVTDAMIDSPDHEPGMPPAVDAEEKRQLAAATAEANHLRRIEKQLRQALRAQGLAHDVQTTIDERGLVVSLVSRHVVFEPDVAQLSLRGQRVVDTLAPVLRDIPNALRIDGHTNQQPVQPRLLRDRLGPLGGAGRDGAAPAERACTACRRRGSRPSAFGHETPADRPEHRPVRRRSTSGSTSSSSRGPTRLQPNSSTTSSTPDRAPTRE